MEEFKSAMLDLIKYQQEQQLSLQKQKMQSQGRMEELRIEIQRQKLELDKSAEIRQQKFEECFFVSNKNRKNCSSYPIAVRMLKMKTHFLKTLFGARSIISLTPLKMKLHLLRT